MSVAGNGGIILTNPDAPVLLANAPLITRSNQIGITWSAGTANGGTPVIDYRINFDYGTDVFSIDVAGLIVTSYTKTGLTAGITYKFKVEARNAFGYSDYSAAVAILTAQEPATPSNPTTSVVGLYVRISWTAPTTNGSPITKYQIKIRQSDGLTFSESIAYCDGSQATIRDNTSCDVPISSLIVSPFSLAWGSSVYAQVRATNVYGNSGVSISGNGAVILTNPDPPTNVVQVTATTTPTAIGLAWTLPAMNGGSAVIDYRISFD